MEPDNADRDRWFDALCVDLLDLARDSGDVYRAYRPLPGYPNLGAAALVAWVCNQASHAATSADIARRLSATAVGDRLTIAVVVTAVRRVRRNWLHRGLPIADWWDADQLLDTVLAYIAPRLVLRYGATYAIEHLRSTFDLGVDAYVTGLAAMPLHPSRPPALPPANDRGESSSDATRGSGLIAYLIGLPAMQESLADRCAGSLLWSGDRARRDWRLSLDDNDDVDIWLRHGYTTLTAWKYIGAMLETIEAHADEAQVRRLMEKYAQDDLDDAKSMASAALLQCDAWLDGLSSAELTLVRVDDPVDVRRRRWLYGYLHIKQLWLLVPDSVPDKMAPDAQVNVPTWVSSNVFDRGARFYHDAAGPLAMWWGVLETDEDQADLEQGLARPGRMTVETDGSSILIHLGLGVQEWHETPLAPFWFHPEEPHSAVELLLVALAGVRLDWFRLRNDRDLEHICAQRIKIPADALSDVLDRIDATFARLEESEPGVAPNAMLARSYMPPNQTEHMFVGVDNAKSEQVLSDLIITATEAGGDNDLLNARSELAAAELDRVSSDANGSEMAGVDLRVAKARRAYHVARQIAGRSTYREFASLTAGVVAQGRAFVQLVEDDDHLLAAVAHTTDAGPEARLVELGNVTPTHARQIADQWLGIAGSGSWEQAADALDVLLQWVGAEIVQPIMEALDDVAARHVVVCPSRALESVPLHAAPTGDARFGDLFSVSYAPSAAVLARLAGLPNLEPRLDLIVASSGDAAPAELALAVLRGPGQESTALQALTGARVIGGERAIPDTVLAEIATARTAHLAAHGWARPDPLASGLCLAGETLGQALLSTARVQAGPPLVDTALVVLSACESARHPLDGRAVQAWRGLDSAFLARGVRSVIASLWKVDDLAALIYGVALHVALVRGESVANAHSMAVGCLRGASVDPLAAQLLDQVRPTWRTDAAERQLSRPYWWSAFRCSGVCW